MSDKNKSYNDILKEMDSSLQERQKQKKISGRKKIIAGVSAVAGLSLLSVPVVIYVKDKKNYVRPYVDYNISQIEDGEIKLPTGSTIGDLVPQTYPGYRFDGWYADEEHTIILRDDVALSNQLTIYGRYVKVTEVNIVVNGVNEVIEIDEGITLLEYFENENSKYNLFNTCGCFSDSQLTTEYYGELTEDLTIYTKTATLDALTFTRISNTAGSNWQVAIKSGVSVNEIVVPKMYETTLVSSVKSNAFKGLTSLISVTLPKSVNTLGASAFENCTSLTNINLENITTIGNSAFKNCLNLTSFDFTNVSTFGSDVFAGCVNLQEIKLPSSVTAITESMFLNFTKLKTVAFASPITTIGTNAFKNCVELSNLTLTFTGSTIEEGAFENCVKLTSLNLVDSTLTEIKTNTFAVTDESLPTPVALSVTLPSSIAEIKNYAFYKSGITSLSLDENLVSVGEYAFYGCLNLTNVSIKNEDNNISFNAHAFEKCSNLKTLSFTCSNMTTSCVFDEYCFAETGLTELTILGNATLKDYSFSNCKSLIKIYESDSIQSITENAFIGCDNVTIVSQFYPTLTALTHFKSSLKNYICSELLTFESGKTFKDFTALETVSASNITLYEACFENCVNLTTIKTDVITNTSIPIRAFYGCSSLTTLPNLSNVTAVEERAFAYSAITEFTGGENLTTIGNYAFEGCANLANISLNNSNLTEIPAYAFANCSGLQNFSCTGRLTAIGEHAFENCINLTLIKDGGNDYSSFYSLTSIGEYSFAGCKSLTTFYPYNADIASYAFAESGLTAVLIYSNGTINAYAYKDCVNLTSVSFYDCCSASVDDLAFVGCTKVTSFYYGSHNKLSFINQFVNLESLTFSGFYGSSVSSFDSSMFSNLTELKTLKIDTYYPYIAAETLKNCSSLTSVTFNFEDGVDKVLYATKYDDEGNIVETLKLDVSDAEQTATYLTSTYADYVWTFSAPTTIE